MGRGELPSSSIGRQPFSLAGFIPKPRVHRLSLGCCISVSLDLCLKKVFGSTSDDLVIPRAERGTNPCSKAYTL